MVRELFNVVPDAWQDEALAAFPTSPRMALKACKGPGKLQPKSLMIDNSFGQVEFGSLRAGDPVFAEDGSETEVIGVFEQGVVPVYRVTFDDGSSTLCGAEHLWKVQGRTERRLGLGWSVLTTAEIIRRGVRVPNGRWQQRQFIIPSQGAAQYPATIQPVDAYVVGVWLGDGSKGEPRYTGLDAEVEREIRDRGYRTCRHADGKDVRLLGCTESFRKLECFALGSHERFVPQGYRQASVQQRRDLLCGLMDTDGCIGKDGHMEFSTTSRRLADDVVWLIRSLGGVGLVKESIKPGRYRGADGQLVECRDCYRVTVVLPFNPFRIGHKIERWSDPARSPSTQRYLTRFIDRIEPAGEEDSICIQVAHPSQCYLTNDFIVTHNTAVLAWIGWNFMLTRLHPRCGVTSITGANLQANLWTELAVWRKRSPLLEAKFEQTKTTIVSREHPETWKMEARTWPRDATKEQIGVALAGLHAPYVLWLADESGDYPPGILPTLEAIFAGAPTEAHVVQAGNPISREGALFHACVTARNLWRVIEITGDPDDPRRSPRISIEHARQQIEQYGRDDPWVQVDIFGQFPPGSLNALIGPEEIDAACHRSWSESDISRAPRVLGVDVARFGDDWSVVWPRQGLVSFIPKRYRNLDGVLGAEQVNRKWLDWDADACFVDDTGGYGSSWIDQLKILGREPIPVGFANRASLEERYANKRMEIYWDGVQWIKNGGQLPPMDTPGMRELSAALCATTYTHRGNKMLLEPKDKIKLKLGYSPDDADAFCLTFAQTVAPRGYREKHARARMRSEYSPIAAWDLERGGTQYRRPY